MTELYGIDLGTRNTAVECRSGKLSGVMGSTIPSAVAYDSMTDEVRYGDAAMQLLGKAEHEQRWSVASSFKTALESDGLFIRAGMRNFSAADVLRDFLRGIVKQVEAAGLPPLRDAVLSIPVGFSAASRMRLTQAAEDVGIRVHGLVSESTAAYLQIAQVVGFAQRVAVVDWGAGTLDVSILNITNIGVGGAVIEESACLGSMTAGDAIDAAIYQALATKARHQERSIPPMESVDVAVLRPILNACERAKISLCDDASPRQEASVVVPVFSDGKAASFAITRAELIELAKPARTAALQVLSDSLERAGLVDEQLDRVIFVGGCTRIAGFQEEARNRFGPAVVFPERPEWTVAGGALRVARGLARYESIQQFCCVLDDGSLFPLTTGQTFDGSSQSIVVATTESTTHAALVFAEREGNIAVANLSIPLVGHVGEPVEIATTLKKDLTVEIVAFSRCGDRTKDEGRVNYANTRFRFRVVP